MHFDRRRSVDDGKGGKEPVVDCALLAESRIKPHRHGEGILHAGKDQRQQELVPGAGKAIEPDHGNAGPRHGQHDFGDDLEQARAFDIGRLFQFDRHGVEEVFQQQQREGQVEHGQRDDDAELVEQPAPLRREIERHQNTGRRQHAQQDQCPEKGIAAGNAQPRQRIGRRNADNDTERRRAGGDQHGIEELPAGIAADRQPEIVEAERPGQFELAGGERVEGVEEEPGKGAHPDDGHEGQGNGGGARRAGGFHYFGSRSMRR